MAKEQKRKVPKSIAGVKLPKPLRRGLRDLAATESGRAVLLEALTAASSALAVVQAGGGDAEASKDGAAEDRAAAMTALAEATRSFTDVLRRGHASEATAAEMAASSPLTH